VDDILSIQLAVVFFAAFPLIGVLLLSSSNQPIPKQWECVLTDNNYKWLSIGFMYLITQLYKTIILTLQNKTEILIEIILL